MNFDCSNPFVFVCGVPRSGTTLFQRMLNSHSEMAVANDTHFIPRALEKLDRALIANCIAGEPIELTPELVSQVSSYHRFFRLGLSDSDVQRCAQQSSGYAEFVSRLYDRFAIKNNKKIAGEKTPDYILRVRVLNGLFPQSRFLHLVRDGRDTALSLMQWALPKDGERTRSAKGPAKLGLWSENPLAVCAMLVAVDGFGRSIAIPFTLKRLSNGGEI